MASRKVDRKKEERDFPIVAYLKKLKFEKVMVTSKPFFGEVLYLKSEGICN